MADMRLRREAKRAEQAESELLDHTDGGEPAEKFGTILSNMFCDAGKQACSCMRHGAAWVCDEVSPDGRKPTVRRTIQKGSRGAHLARMAAVKRGVTLATWRSVREARKAHTWESSSRFKRALVTVVAVGQHIGQAARKLANCITAVCSNHGGGGCMQQDTPCQHARALAYKLARKVSIICSKRRQKRALHAAMFGATLAATHTLVPAGVALAAAYLLVKIAAGSGADSHGTDCRGATAATVTLGAGVGVGVGWGLLGGLLVALCPRSCLWWPAMKRPAATLQKPCSKRPAATMSSSSPVASRGRLLLKRPAASQGEELQAEWRPLLQRVSEWQAAHRGSLPKRTSKIPEEKDLAKKLSYVPRSLRPAKMRDNEEVYLKLARDMLAYLQANGGEMPKETAGAPGYALAHRWRDRPPDGMRVSSELRRLLHAVRDARGTRKPGWSESERAQHRRPLQQLQKQLASNYTAWCAAHDQQVRPELPALQTLAAPGQAFAGRSPYPGFTNLASTCYINAVLQCLFHCGRVREALAGKETGDGRCCTTQLAKLMAAYVHGIKPPDSATLVKVDVYAPHEFADFVRASRPAFVLGSQHDAADFLSWLLQHTSVGHDCCRVGQVPRSDYELVHVNEIQAGSPMAGLVQRDTICMGELLVAALGNDDTRLRQVPQVLLLRLPQCVLGGDDEEHRWVQEEATCRPKASWATGSYDLRACCSADCRGRPEAVYRIRAFVQYCRRPPVPSLAISSGHYAAFFQEAGVWYRCDDLRDGALPVALPGAPSEYPYICVFEQIGRCRTSPADMPPNPVAPARARGGAAELEDNIAVSSAEAGGDSTEGVEGELSSRRRGKLGKRDRKGRKQDRHGRAKRTEDRKDRKEDRKDRKQDRGGRKEDREGRAQERKGQQQDRSGRAKRSEDSIKRARTQGPRNDNTDASRKDVQADADSPVQHHLENTQVQQQAALCRRRFGHLFVLLHVLGNTMAGGTSRQP